MRRKSSRRHLAGASPIAEVIPRCSPIVGGRPGFHAINPRRRSRLKRSHSLLLLRETDVSIRVRVSITAECAERIPDRGISKGGERRKLGRWRERSGGGGGGHRRVTGSGKMAVRDLQQTIIPHVASAFDTFDPYPSARESCRQSCARARARVPDVDVSVFISATLRTSSSSTSPSS